MQRFVKIMLIYGLWVTCAFAKSTVIDLSVDTITVNFAGKPVQAIAVNHQIPGPTLHFKEGEAVTLRVHNHLKKETAIHWHGVLVPWQMDGVKGISQQGIQPGETFVYQFTLHQSGTYWYHAHAGLQEQLGLYGAFIIDPKTPPKYQATKDYVVVLSDWSNTDPDQILANLKKEGDYYSPRFPLQPSLMRFIHDYRRASPSEKHLLLSDYKMMQDMRMSIYDLSDVAYDAFLLNGQTAAKPWVGYAKKGDVVRLRFIGAGASTIFHVKIPGEVMKVVQVDGNDIRPYTASEFAIAPGETVDVLVSIQNDQPKAIYAESLDTSGAVIGLLASTANANVDMRTITPFPTPQPVTRDMHMSMPMDKSMDMPMHMSMPMTQATEAETKYQSLTAAVKTNDPHKPIEKTINMELSGYMDRFIWFINGVPEHQAAPIILQPSKRYRFVFKNTSMMHHPMHIHGHWFILRNGKGAYDPLLHTIDVPPGATLTADVDTDASGQWIFHCHLLYHMVAGMSRTLQYSSLLDIVKGEEKPQTIVHDTAYYNRPIVRVDEVRPIDAALVHHPMPHPEQFWFSTRLDVSNDPFDNLQRMTYQGLYGSDNNKLSLFMSEAEMSHNVVDTADLDVFYWHLIDQFWAVKGGVNYHYRPALTPYWQPGVGLEGVLPYFIDTGLRLYYRNGSAKLDIDLSRDTQITNNFFIRLGVSSMLATKSVDALAVGSGLNQMEYIVRPFYRLLPGFDVYIEYENMRDYGAYKNILRSQGEGTGENMLSLGVSALF